MYQLYYAPDNASLIVRMVLEALEAEYSTVLVDRSQQEQQSEAYRLLNPNGLIPVCVIDDQPIYETGAIVLALAERHRRLVPAINDSKRAVFFKWLFFISNTVHTDLRQMFYPEKYAADTAAAQAAHRALTLGRFEHSLGVLENHCREHAAPFVMGEVMSVIDIYLSVCLRWAQLYPKDAPCLDSLDAFPALRRICAAVAERDSTARACAAEGIAAPFFEKPRYAQPPEGSAT